MFRKFIGCLLIYSCDLYTLGNKRGNCHPTLKFLPTLQKLIPSQDMKIVSGQWTRYVYKKGPVLSLRQTVFNQGHENPFSSYQSHGNPVLRVPHHCRRNFDTPDRSKKFIKTGYFVHKDQIQTLYKKDSKNPYVPHSFSNSCIINYRNT